MKPGDKVMFLGEIHAPVYWGQGLIPMKIYTVAQVCSTNLITLREMATHTQRVQNFQLIEEAFYETRV